MSASKGRRMADHEKELLELINRESGIEFHTLDQAYQNISVDWLNRLLVVDIWKMLRSQSNG